MPRAKFRVGDSYVQSKAYHCNFEGDDCWYVRVQPVIDSIDKPTGSVTGGQELTITGFGLNGDAVVEVDGVPCDVRSATETKIVCFTGAAPRISLDGYQPGQPGVIKTTVDPEDENHGLWWHHRYNGEHPRT